MKTNTCGRVADFLVAKGRMVIPFGLWLFLAACAGPVATIQPPQPIQSTPTSVAATETPETSQVTPTPARSSTESVPDLDPTAPKVDQAPEPTDGPPALPPVPDLDTSLSSVPLEEVYFDTFRPIDRAVPLSRASTELIEELRDAIPPIHNPIYEQAQEATWLQGVDVVVGYETQGQAWAYPVKILNYHEIVNDILVGEPVLISYCPLCYSGIVYSRRLDGDILTFGNTSALYESDMVMLDYETGSYWWQVAGRAIVGPLTDRSLDVLPSITTSWAAWQRLHPQTLVLSRETGYTRNYDQDPFIGFQDFINEGRFAFPVSEAARDDRLRPGEIVLVVQVGSDVRAYPLERLTRRVLHDTLHAQDVVVLIEPNRPSAAAFSPQYQGETLSFEDVGGMIVDTGSGSEWDISGTAVAGPLKGARLPPLPSKTSFWYGIVAAEPQIEVYSPPADNP